MIAIVVLHQRWIVRAVRKLSDRSPVMRFVYILQSDKNRRFYIGSSSDIDRSLDEHNKGKVKATKSTVPFTMVFCQEFETLSEARRIEARLKRLKSKEIIDKIIKNKKLSIKRL